MNNPESVQIIDRFFEAFDALKDMGKIKNNQQFIDRYKIPKSTFYDSRRVRESDRFQISWLAHLINDYGVSPEWLFSGKGKMFA